MFADIAPSYDFLNHFLSANADRAWRRAAVRMAAPRAGDRILDVCTGTGDLLLEALRQSPGSEAPRLVGADFCPEMLRIARRKSTEARQSDGASPAELRWVVADTLRLPFADRSFDIVTVGFGIRNVGDLGAGLKEMHRVLKPGGRAVVLEFSTPRSRAFRRLFDLYFHHVLPRLGRWLSSAPRPRDEDAYRYLPRSVARFPDAEGLSAILEAAGFAGVRYRRLSFGIAAIHLGEKTPAAAREPERR
jgi:demethylmenaquinone methyltransferase/2-methoxy-6-polyprenyl-1,4-benzoquinol methylase